MSTSIGVSLMSILSYDYWGSYRQPLISLLDDFDRINRATLQAHSPNVFPFSKTGFIHHGPTRINFVIEHRDGVISLVSSSANSYFICNHFPLRKWPVLWCFWELAESKNNHRIFLWESVQFDSFAADEHVLDCDSTCEGVFIKTMC